MERQLISDYRQAVDAVLEELTLERLDTAVTIARIPEEIRGYGPVKARSLERAKAQWRALGDQYRVAASEGAADKLRVVLETN